MRFSPLGILVGFLLLLLIVLVRSMNSSLPLYCPISAQFGIFCPGCGAWRSLLALSYGNVLKALSHNILVLPALFGVVFFLFFSSKVKGRIKAVFNAKMAPTIIVLVVVVFTLLRNMPIEALVFLRP